MRAIIVDDERLMIQKFVRLTAGITDLNIVSMFDLGEVAVSYVRDNPVEAALTAMPVWLYIIMRSGG